MIDDQILKVAGNNIEFVDIDIKPIYEKKLLSRLNSTDEDKLISILKDNTTITYKFYEISLDDEPKAFVDTIEEAEQMVNSIKEEHNNDIDLDLKIIEKYTNNIEEVKTDSIEIAENNLENEIIKIEQENSVPSINGIKLAQTPVKGTITSRYGASSRIRRSSHTGLDIACKAGTDIKVVASGKVVFAGKSGSYGNLVKVDHGNGVETWYAHCNSIYAKEGKQVKQGDVIAAVGSTGNSTGPHLHLEIRVNGNTINPQNYLY